MSRAPLLAVLVPAWRAVPFLDRTLASARTAAAGLGPGEVEVTVSNDGGEAQAEVDAICARHGARAVHQRRRLGWVGNCNALIEAVRAPFFAILPHDDEAAEGSWARLLGALEAAPRAAAAFGDVAMLNLPDQPGKVIAGQEALGPRSERVRRILEGTAAGVSFRAVQRTPWRPRTAGLWACPVDAILSDSAWMMDQAARGEVLRVPGSLHLKHYHASNTHAAWRYEPPGRAAAAWSRYVARITAVALAAAGRTPEAAAALRQAGEVRALAPSELMAPPWLRASLATRPEAERRRDFGRALRAERARLALDRWTGRVADWAD